MAESNFFRVKDEAAFLAWARKCGLNVSENTHDGHKVFSISVDDDEEDSWPHFYYDEESEENVDVDIGSEVAEHLQDDCVAVLIEADGSNGFAYGFAEAVNNKGESVHINLQDIYNLAEPLGKEILNP